VLAGPMLCKVTSTNVTVWVALRGKVTLKVLDTELDNKPSF
jgi:hypothetical protein